MSDRHTADTITDDALDQLYAQLDEASEQLRLVDALRQQHHDAATAAVDRATRAEADLKTLGQTALGYQQRAWDAEAELKQAQAALDRVRAAADKLADGTETGFRAALTIREAIDQPKEQPMQHEKHTPIDWKALAEQNERRWKDEGNRRAAAEAERDRAYRERAHLVALLAAMTDTAVLAPADDVDEPGWAILYLTLDGRQASWHISPNDGDLFDHVPVVTGPEHPGARWDGHTTEEKYRRIAEYTAQLAKARQT